MLARESNLPKWRELLIAFRRLEDRGEVRGGRFVSGFLGEQFALPEAVESLRAMRNLPASGEIITISAADPLNLVGFIVPGERVRRDLWQVRQLPRRRCGRSRRALARSLLEAAAQ